VIYLSLSGLLEFNRFLSEQNDSEDLTFFLFARSLVEKELAIVLTNKNLSNDGALLNQKNCYRILEAVYGKDEKQLINRVFRKIREQIEWEKEVNIGPDVNKINMYSFLKLLLEDYHSSRLVTFFFQILVFIKLLKECC